MIEIIDYKPSNYEGSFKGTFSVKIDKWNLIIRGMRHIKTDKAEFVTMPEKMKKEDDKWTKDFAWVDFTSNETRETFKKACLTSIRLYNQRSEDSIALF